MARKIAILGGGASSLFAAWDLMKTDPTAYDLTVYQVGWRLGGKGASGRRASDDRIEEHGLHLMFGFYQNVFRVVREAYALAYDDPERWKEFFKSAGTTLSMMHYLDAARQDWEAWDVPHPAESTTEHPGDPDVPEANVRMILQNAWRWLRGLAREVPDLAEVAELSTEQLRKTIDELDGVADGRIDVWGIAHRFVDTIASLTLHPDEHAAEARRFDQLLTRATRYIPAELRALVDFVMAVTRGLFVDLILRGSENWFDLDEYDFRAWITRHGGDAASPVVEGLYDAVFSSYSELGAGSILQAAMKAGFLFRGSAIYKMQAGMGDTIFTPLYLALRARGVKFKFFHRVVGVTTGPDARAVESIVFERQVADADAYDPLHVVEVDLGAGPRPLACWPSEPIWDRIAEPERTRVRSGPSLENYWTPPDLARRVTLRRVDGVASDGEFNDVILGISVAALPDLCAPLLEVDPRFATHVEYLAKATTATQAMQLWTVPGKLPVQPNPLVVPNGDPYDTIADMSHLLRAERHPAGTVDGLFYLCSALLESSPPSSRADAGYPRSLLDVATANGRAWVATRGPVLWRNRATTSGFDWAALYDPEGRTGEARFDAQYVNTPTSLSDRYVLAPPMTNRYRLKTNETRFANLYLTGDWIKTSLSIGCLEAAAMAGIQTARAISLERGGRLVPRAHGDWIEDVAVRGARTTAPPPSPTAPARNTLDVVSALVHDRLARVLDRGRALAHDLMTVVTGPAAPRPTPPPPRRPVTYVRRDSELLGRPPFELRCDNLFLFVLRANRGRLQRICDRELNLGPTRYTPVGDTVVLYAATLTNLAMGTTCRSSEVGIWMPIESDGAAIHTYSPYVWIDSGTSMIGGRGIYGYTKQPAQVTVPSGGQPSRIAVTSDALVAASARGAWQLEPSPLLTIEPPTIAPWTPPHQDLSSWLDLTRLVANFIGPNPERLAAMMSAGMKSIFLKQLPDIDGERAAYQAIVEASITPALGTVRGVSMNSTPWTIAIPAYHAPNIVDTLGLEATVTSNHELLRTATVTPTAQVWMQFEGRLDPGVEIWRAE